MRRGTVTETGTVRIEEWSGHIPGGRNELNQLWRLMDAVADKVKIPSWEVNERVDRMTPHIYNDSIFLVAEVDDVVQGVCIAEVGNTANTKHVGWLRMDVHPEFQGQGIGTKLLEQMVRIAKGRGLKRLEITSYEDNPRAREFFLKHGFDVEGHHRKARRDPETGTLLDTYTLATVFDVD